MDASGWAERIGALAAAAGLGAIGSAAVKAWRKPSAPDEMIVAAKDAAKDMLKELRAEVERLAKLTATLSRNVSDLQQENIQCRGENRALWGYITSLERDLRKAGVPIPTPAPPQAFAVIEGDRATVMQPILHPKPGDRGPDDT